MSNLKFDSDGFQIVSKRFSKNKQTKVPIKTNQFVLSQSDSNIDIEKAKSRISTAVNDLKSSLYLGNVLESVSTALHGLSVSEIVCFGLGHIGECRISRHQLALLLSLKERLNPKKVFVHDPIFYKSECEILKCLHLEVIPENREGSYIISDQGVTLVYLPHCPKQLTNNFLWSNWGSNIKNCLLICNSFTSLIENQPNRTLQENCPYILKIHPYTTEILLENNFHSNDIFNDTSLHYFTEDKLNKIDSAFWNKGEKPEYKDTEEFISSLMVEKLNI